MKVFPGFGGQGYLIYIHLTTLDWKNEKKSETVKSMSTWETKWRKNVFIYPHSYMDSALIVLDTQRKKRSATQTKYFFTLTILSF